MPNAAATFIETFKRNAVAPDPMVNLGIEPIFVTNLFAASNARRMRQGSKGLILEAARTTVEFFKGSFAARQRAEQPVFHWTAADYDALAREIAVLLPTNPKVRLIVARWLDEYRVELLSDPRLTKSIPNLTNYNSSEVAMDTFNRVLDFIEHVECCNEYTFFFDLKRHVTKCVRVGEAIFRPVEAS